MQGHEELSAEEAIYSRVISFLWHFPVGQTFGAGLSVAVSDE